MTDPKYKAFTALDPFFDIVQEGLAGQVDGDHYFDTIAENAVFEFRYIFPGYPQRLDSREALMALYAGYGNNIVLHGADALVVRLRNPPPLGRVILDALFGADGSWTWVLLTQHFQHGARPRRAASPDPLNPLAPPGGRLEGIREILCLVNDLTVAELHNAHCVRHSPLVGDCVFRDPEITFSENSFDVEARRLAWMVTPQGLQIASPEDSFARLRIITNCIVIVNIVFRVCITGGRCVPVSIKGFTNLFLLHGLPR